MEKEIKSLKNNDAAEYPRPSVTADVAVFTVSARTSLSILLIKRGNPPFKDRWALPGGFMEPGETVEECAMRELYEETGIVPESLFPVGVFSAPGRDPRGWTISNSFACAYCTQKGAAVSGDDAKEAAWFDVTFDRVAAGKYKLLLKHDDLSILAELNAESSHYGDIAFKQTSSGLLAFDHAEMIAAAVYSIKYRTAMFNTLFDFLPADFTLDELKNVFETVTCVKMTPDDFKECVKPFIAATERSALNNDNNSARIYNRAI